MVLFPQFNPKIGKVEHIKITRADEKRVFDPFYDAQPESPVERDIFCDFIDDNLSFRQLGVLPPELLADYVKFEALRREYYREITDHVYSESSTTYMRLKAYDHIAAELLELIKYIIFGKESEPDAL